MTNSLTAFSFFIAWCADISKVRIAVDISDSFFFIEMCSVTKIAWRETKFCFKLSFKLAVSFKQQKTLFSIVKQVANEVKLINDSTTMYLP